jgi:DNA-binding transcriptional regulator LsrR (DeoR family)
MEWSPGESGLLMEDEAGLATRAAWLYHAGSLTQSQVAERLGVTSVKAHRLIARATRAGLVRVFVQGPIGNCIANETALSERYGLRFCRVVPGLDESRLPLRALGIAAAGFLRDMLESGRHGVIGVGHGRTLAAAVDHLPRMPATGLKLVSLLGSLPRRVPANPFEVVDRLADKTGADAYMLPIPMFARAAADRAVLREQAGVAQAMALAREASLLMMGIGEATAEAFLVVSGVIAPEELREARDAGAAGEMLGTFFDANGNPVATALHERIIVEPLRPPGPDRDVVAVAGGIGKAPAIHAVLRSRLLTGLITDELTARQLVAAAS